MKSDPSRRSGSPDIVFGRRPVLSALDNGRVVKLWISRGAGGDVVADLVRRARGAGVVFQWVDRFRLAALAPGGAHQGVAARVSPVGYQTLDDVWDRGRPTPLLVLDGVTDPRNVGAILRNAAFFGAEGVIVPRWRSAGITGVMDKSSAGTLGLVPMVQVANTGHTLRELREKGYKIFGADAGGRPLAHCVMTGPLALVLGGEGEGLRRLTRELCDEVVAIPGAGRVASLNVSCAAAVLLHDLFSRRAREKDLTKPLIGSTLP